jgi:hypothetical protein
MRRFGRPHSQLEKTAPPPLVPGGLGRKGVGEVLEHTSRNDANPEEGVDCDLENRPVEVASEPRPKRRRRSSITVKRTRSTLLT